MGDHLREAFDRELQALQEDLLEMARATGEQIHRAVEALKALDVDLADTIIAADYFIDQMQDQLEQRCVRLLATQQPMGRDLRAIMAAFAIGIDLERMADHAEGIAKATKRLSGRPHLKPLIDIPRMEEIFQGMLADALNAYINRDPDLAERMTAQDDVVDALRTQVFRELLTIMMEDPRTISQALDLILVAQHLERAADHATNIGERVIYMVTGELKELNV
ncbi:MAG: phosphate signaling complex protein PhoU [Armatimonadota bacterium]|nr:phosphate signaling complex protein PhoU [Armatimonadota bacterium]MDR5702636.1 phosphate signaling complex protein PhoU [Armatimonadota bacterium]